MRVVNVVPPELRRGAFAVAAVALLAGCGVSGGGDARPGFPIENPTAVHKRQLTPTLEHVRLHLPVPAGWSAAKLDPINSNWSMVRLAGDCYLSISITGAASTRSTVAKIRTLYRDPANGHGWTLTESPDRVIALLNQGASGTRPPSRSTLGNVYLLQPDGSYLVIDIGAGIWPLRHHACGTADFQRHIEELDSSVQGVFANARVQPPVAATE